MLVLYFRPSRMFVPPSGVRLLQLRSRLLISLLSLRRSLTAPLLSKPIRFEERLRCVISLSSDTAFRQELCNLKVSACYLEQCDSSIIIHKIERQVNFDQRGLSVGNENSEVLDSLIGNFVIGKI